MLATLFSIPILSVYMLIHLRFLQPAGLVAFLILLLAQPAFCQDSLRTQKVTRFVEIGVSANAYRGDLALKYQKWSSLVHAGLQLNFKKRFNSHLNVSVGTLTGQNLTYVHSGEDTLTPSPNQFFKTSVITANYDLQLNLLKHNGWTVFVSQGIGIIRFEPKNADNQPLQNDFTTRPTSETYNNVSLMLPTQLGVHYVFNNGYGVGVQSGWLNQQTDYVDNISQWGNREKKDNVLWVRFAFMVPVTWEK